ncbi:protein angel homolog 2 isoform X1 [Takifugu rubripes]|uniref:protein angel homolog 2 isoform X1 n=2 Tax=Takifugu rubripes TaxID=31033 RepID=UPI001145B94B|nr:protein angel homolog 2 isoform X1 [Takifugu rubripes]
MKISFYSCRMFLSFIVCQRRMRHRFASTSGTWGPWTEEKGRRPPSDCQPVKRKYCHQALKRRWEGPASSSYVRPPRGSAAFDFSVMSYNILSQELLQDNAYLYRHCDPGILPWNHRLPNLLAEIKQHDADILCLQEVQEDHYENQIKPALLTLGYQCEYKKRTGSKPDGCAIVFKSSRLSLLSSNPIEFLCPGDTLLDRDNVGLVLLLQPHDAASSSGRPTSICVANTHLLYNPRRGDIKLAQLAILLAEISRFSRPPNGSSSPVVLCGDFNSTPLSPLYRFLTTGRLNYSGLKIGSVSGQENSPRGQRLLPSPIWSHSLGIDHQCQYRNEPAAAASSSSLTEEGASSEPSTPDPETKAEFKRLRIEHNLNLRSTYQHLLPPNGRPEITTHHSRTALTVDYIMYTPDTVTYPNGRGLHLLGRLSLVGQAELEEVNGLPNHHHSSDHLPLLARFRLCR